MLWLGAAVRRAKLDLGDPQYTNNSHATCKPGRVEMTCKKHSCLPRTAPSWARTNASEPTWAQPVLLPVPSTQTLPVRGASDAGMPRQAIPPVTPSVWKCQRVSSPSHRSTVAAHAANLAQQLSARPSATAGHQTSFLPGGPAAHASPVHTRQLFSSGFKLQRGTCAGKRRTSRRRTLTLGRFGAKHWAASAPFPAASFLFLPWAVERRTLSDGYIPATAQEVLLLLFLRERRAVEGPIEPDAPKSGFSTAGASGSR